MYRTKSDYLRAIKKSAPYIITGISLLTASILQSIKLRKKSLEEKTEEPSFI